MPEPRPVRIANFSGFYGDRASALAEMIYGGSVDALTGDYLAEVTMLVLARSRLKRPDGGYAAGFLRQLEPVAAAIAERGLKVVTNAGGLDPAGMAQAVQAILERLGVELSVAHVEGDDVLSRLNDLDGVSTLANPLTANAYLGGFGIATALSQGVDIVITGRVADASLTSGVAAWWWGWTSDDLDALAGAVVAGHVIECGAQATGGNFSGFQEINLGRPGFPIAEIDRDGSSVITKHPGTDGAVTTDTVTAQLLYEVDGPAYLNPDVVARLDTASLSALGVDRVQINGVRGLPPPPTTKVAITGLGRWRNSVKLVLTGLDVDAKAAAIEKAVRARLGKAAGIHEIRFTRIGQPAADAADQMAGSCLLQITVDGEEAACGRTFSSAVVELGLSSVPGLYLTDPPGSGSQLGAYRSALISQAALTQTVVFSDGRSYPIVASPGASVPAMETEPTRNNQESGPIVDAPLGKIVHARSGDKGGNANLGVWVANPDAWPWLASTLTTECLRRLLPEVTPLHIDRYEFPNLHGLNFVIHGLLDSGATEARRLDTQAKALGEWLRARHLPLPTRFLG